MDKGVILGGDAANDPAAGHHGELVEEGVGFGGITDQFSEREKRELEGAGGEEFVLEEKRELTSDPDTYEEEDDPEDSTPWHLIARDQDWTPDQIIEKRREITQEVADTVRALAMKKIAVGGLGTELVMRMILDRLFLGLIAVSDDPDAPVYMREPHQERELFELQIAETQLAMLHAADADGTIRKVELSHGMVQGPGGLMIPGNREERRREEGKGRRGPKPGHKR